MVVGVDEMELYWRWCWHDRPVQQIEMGVEDFYRIFCIWKEEMARIGYPGDEENFVDDFISGLKWNLRLRLSKYRSKPSMLSDAFRCAKFEGVMAELEETMASIQSYLSKDTMEVEATAVQENPVYESLVFKDLQKPEVEKIDVGEVYVKMPMPISLVQNEAHSTTQGTTVWEVDKHMVFEEMPKSIPVDVVDIKWGDKILEEVGEVIEATEKNPINVGLMLDEMPKMASTNVNEANDIKAKHITMIARRLGVLDLGSNVHFVKPHLVEQHIELLDVRSKSAVEKHVSWKCASMPMFRVIHMGVNAFLTPFIKEYLSTYVVKLVALQFANHSIVLNDENNLFDPGGMTTSLGSCNFWAALVLNEESSYAGFSEGLFPFTNSEVTTKAYAKRRLVEHGRYSAARTTLIDDQSDYYDFKEKSWLYKQQVKGELVLTPLLVTISVIEVNNVGFSLMINLFHSEVGMHLLWFIIRKCLSSYSALVMFDTHWDLKIWKLHCSPKALTVSVPDDGVVKAASLPSHAYITFLAGNGDHVKSVVALAKGLSKVKGAYPLAVIVLPDILDGHHKILVNHGCTVCEIELICPPENLNQFAMAFYVINYSKLRIWKFVESSKMAMLEILLERYQDVSFHVMRRMLRVRTGLCYEQLVSVGLRNKLAAAAVDSLECEIAMVILYFLVMIVQPNLFGPQMQATSLKAALLDEILYYVEFLRLLAMVLSKKKQIDACLVHVCKSITCFSWFVLDLTMVERGSTYIARLSFRNIISRPGMLVIKLEIEWGAIRHDSYLETSSYDYFGRNESAIRLEFSNNGNWDGTTIFTVFLELHGAAFCSAKVAKKGVHSLHMAAIMENFVWDPGDGMYHFHILEDKDVLKGRVMSRTRKSLQIIKVIKAPGMTSSQRICDDIC